MKDYFYVDNVCYTSERHRFSSDMLFYDDFVEERFIVDEFTIICNRSAWYEHFCIMYGYENVPEDQQ